MTKSMLVDASHPEETRVVVQENGKLVDFDYESATKRQIKGNVYLAKITRVEPSLQAAFVEYGGNRHGFLAFSEIHTDYFQIPQADRELLEQTEPGAEEDGEQESDGQTAPMVPESEEEETAEVWDEQARERARLLRSYKIQEVIKRRQIMLVQVVKEERGNKGAALTTYLSLAGRYCVLMPNTPRGGGISRKIANPNDRRRLKDVALALDVPQGMGLIIRTAGQQRNKSEIRRDYDYLLRLWEQIRATTLESIAPALIYEEGDLVKRAMRDLYTRDIEEVLVEGEDTYKTAKKLMGMLMPSRARTVKLYKGELPVFVESGVEEQLDNMFTPHVDLPSGGSIVIHVTEALTAIDVNSGKATRERHIDETAVKTNVEATEMISRHLRLRDIAGLIVIDFIDMNDNKHQRRVERHLREALKNDRARLQIGKISTFGLLEMSRQRLRSSLQELSSHTCPHCNGQGTVRSVESCALQTLRKIQDAGLNNQAAVLDVHLPLEVTLYLLNNKRDLLVRLEQRFDMRVHVIADEKLQIPFMNLRVREPREGDHDDNEAVERNERPERKDRVERPGRRQHTERSGRGEQDDALDAAEDGDGRKRRRRRRRRRKGDNVEASPAEAEPQAVTEMLQDASAASPTDPSEQDQPAAEAENSDQEKPAPRQRQRRTRRSRAATVPDGIEPSKQIDGSDPVADDQPTPINRDAEATQVHIQAPDTPDNDALDVAPAKARVANDVDAPVAVDLAFTSSAQILAELDHAGMSEDGADHTADDGRGTAEQGAIARRAIDGGEIGVLDGTTTAGETSVASSNDSPNASANDEQPLQPETQPYTQALDEEAADRAIAEDEAASKSAKTGWWSRFVR